jgi:hypothetical protein
MNLHSIRVKFSIFLRQFQIEDLKLLMEFLELVVNEYKSSRADRLLGKGFFSFFILILILKQLLLSNSFILLIIYTLKINTLNS